MPLKFDNENKMKGYNHLFKYYNASGFLLEKHEKIPVIILDLAPEFNVAKINIEYSKAILNEIIIKTNIKPYITFIYKTPIIKKKTIETDIDILPSLNNISKELAYIIQNFYYKYQDILIICLGKYAEYNYLFTILKYMLKNDHNDINIIKIYNHHISAFLNTDSDNTKKQILNADITRINKILENY